MSEMIENYCLFDTHVFQIFAGWADLRKCIVCECACVFCKETKRAIKIVNEKAT